MTPTELRALADALEPLASLERSGSQGALALESTIAYLRAQADAQPVAWIAHNLTTGHVKWTTDRCRARGWTRSVNLRVKPLYAHPAPAVPQAEPIDPHMIVAEDRFPDAQVEPKPTPASGDDLNVYREMADSYRNDAQAEPKRSQPLLDLLAVIHCDGGDHTEAVGIERSIKNAQDAVCALKVRLALAEPKREPLSDERIDTALQTDPVLITRLMIGSMTVGEFRAALRRLARIVERALEIGGSDAGTD